jgi:hypothetical protein
MSHLYSGPDVSFPHGDARLSPYQSIHLTRYDAGSGAKGRIDPYADAKKK